MKVGACSLKMNFVLFLTCPEGVGLSIYYLEVFWELKSAETTVKDA